MRINQNFWVKKLKAFKVGVPLVMITSSLLTGCGADKEAPALLSEGEGSTGRDAYFTALWNGDYQQVDTLIPLLQAEAEEGDDKSQAILGFTHAWKLAEYRRVAGTDPDITQHAGLAVDAFDKAIKAFPGDARLLGFRGSFRQAQGSIESNQLLTTMGWFDEVFSSQRWPAWGLFTKAYGLITFDPSDDMYQQGIDALWENIDACAEEKVDRENFRLADYPQLFQVNDDIRIERACTNTAVAPHNLEGFFLYFGDMYAKAAQLDRAEQMYEIALSLDEGDWPYADVARQRINRLEELPTLFSIERPRTEPVSVEETNMFESPINCVSCHQGAPNS